MTKLRNILAPLSLLAGTLLVTAGCSSAPATGTAITNVTVIDVVHGARKNQTVLFTGDSILSVSASVDAPAAEHTIDGSGKFLIPGLWDMHVHLTYDSRFTPIMPELFLRYGVTSVRDTGGLLYNLLPLVRTMRARDSIAPRVFFSGPLLDGQYVVYNGDSVPEIGISNADVKDARDNVRALHDAGVDFIKIYELVSAKVFDALVAEANDLKLPIAAHVPLSMTASSVAPNVDSLEHLRNVELDCASDANRLHQVRLQKLHNEESVSGLALRSSLHQLQRQNAIDRLDGARCRTVLESLKNVIQVPTTRLNTLILSPAWQRDDWRTALMALPIEVQNEWREPPSWFNPDPAKRDTRVAEYSLEMIRRMHAAGVPIGAGTDTPIGHAIPGYSLHNELEGLVRAGLTPLDALRAATLRPAEFFSLDDEMGSIDSGRYADMVLLDADPLVDIRNTKRINLVVYRGKIMEIGKLENQR